jgi:predicted permease
MNMSQWLSDVRGALGMLRRAPGTAIVTMLTMAIGIGLTTAVFSLIYAVLLRPLPYAAPDRLVAIWQQHAQSNRMAKVFDSYRDFTEWQRHSRSFEGLAALTWARGTQTLTGHGIARPVTAFPTSIELFSLLGAQALHGRTFVTTDLDRGCSVVLAHRFWRNTLGADAGIVGQSLTLDRHACTVVGVMPPAFTFFPEAADIWTLITPQSEFVQQPDAPQSQVGVFGRLKPGITIAEAQTELEHLHRALHARGGSPGRDASPGRDPSPRRNGSPEHGSSSGRDGSPGRGDSPGRGSSSGTRGGGAAGVDPDRLEFSPVVFPLRQELTWLAGRNLRTSLLVLFGAVIVVLLVACLNVAGLLVSRGLTREREFALRSALGSTRTRIMQQVLTEGAVLATIGAAGGLLVASGALRIMEWLRPVELPPGTHLTLDRPVLLFAVAATAVTTVLFGLWPAWRASRTDVNVILQSAGQRSGSRSGWGFTVVVIAEVTLSVLVLSGAALLIQSVRLLGNTPLGFNPDRVVTQRLTLPEDRATNQYVTAEQRWRFYDPRLARVRAEPGVALAAISSSLPMSVGSSPVTIEGRADTVDTLRYDVGEQAVTPDYFRLLDIPLRRGRLFDDRDRREGMPVAIINDALAREYFPDEDPIGKRIRAGRPDAPDRGPLLTIVGVIGTEQRTNVFQEMALIGGGMIFRPLSQSTPARAVLLARAISDSRASTDSDSASASASVSRAIARHIATLDPSVPVAESGLLRDELDTRLSYPRFRAALLGLFAALAVFLAALGLYSVLSHSVAQRGREIAIRMALGATRADVLRRVTWQGLKLTAAGTALGLIAAWNSTRLLATLLYGVAPTDAPTLTAAALLVLAVSAVATFIPARRAAGLDPLVALKRE